MAIAPSVTPVRAWWQASRPATLAASVAPVLAGSAAALHDGHARLGPALAALGVGLAMQLGVNFANDYSDFVRGADTDAREGPVRAAASGLIPPRRIRTAAVAAFAAAALIGLGLSLATNPWLIAVGACCVVAGWLYTGGPRPYGYLGLGEVFVFVFFGLVATTGTAYVQELKITPLALLAAVPMGCLASAVLVLNNLRDVNTDRAAGKMTLAVRLGRERTRRLLAGLLTAALLVPVVVAAARLAPPTVLLPLLLSPLALGILGASGHQDSPTLVKGLKRAAALELFFSALWAIGLAA